MICHSCAAAGDLTTAPAPQLVATRTLARQLHRACSGCPCAHRVPSAAVVRARRQAMPRGGLARVVNLLAGS